MHALKVNVNYEAVVAERKKIGEKLRELRLQKRLTTHEVGEMLGIDRTQISRIENGSRNYSVDFLIILNNFYA